MTWMHAAWPYYIAFFFGGAVLTNAIPHFVCGVMGKPFQSPFAKPPGEGFSSSKVNVLWGFLNIVIGYVLLGPVGKFDLGFIDEVVAAGLGVLLFGYWMAGRFGRFNGGAAPKA